jgi:hypothetical protein
MMLGDEPPRDPGLRGKRRPKRRRPEEPPELEVPPEDADRLPVVNYDPGRCPRCGRQGSIYGKYGRVRYHTCPDCGSRFKSCEVPWAPPRPSG